MKKKFIVVFVLIFCMLMLCSCNKKPDSVDVPNAAVVSDSGGDGEAEGGDDIQESDPPMDDYRVMFSEYTEMYGKLCFGMEFDDVFGILGSDYIAVDSETYDEDYFIYGHHIDIDYPQYGLSLQFFDVDEKEDLRLGTITFIDEKAVTVGGLHIGSSMDEVLELIYDDFEKRPVYSDGSVDPDKFYYLYGEMPENCKDGPEYAQYGIMNVLYDDSNMIQLTVAAKDGGRYDEFEMVIGFKDKTVNRIAFYHDIVY